MDERANGLTMEYESHISEHEERGGGPWYSGTPILKDQAESVRLLEKKSSQPPSPETTCAHRPFENGAVEDCAMEGSGCNGYTHPQDSFRPIPIRMTRSYGSSSASSASTLMTPRDSHSWVSSTHSPQFVEMSDSGLTPRLFLPTKFGKDLLYGDSLMNWESKFPLIPVTNSPGSAEPEWFVDDHTQETNLPAYLYRSCIDTKGSKQNYKLESNQQHSKQTNKAPRSLNLPGLGIIEMDGSHNQGITFPFTSRARHGPLTPQQRHDAALIRRRGACKGCRKRKVKCNIFHRTTQMESPSPTPPPRGPSPSFPSLVLAVTALQRCIDRRYTKQIILLDISGIPISEQISRQASYFENMTLQGLDLQSLFVRSQETTESSEANSINSFDDVLTEYSHDDSALYFAAQVQDAGSEEFLAAIQPLLDRLPEEIASSLGNELLCLFGIWLGNQGSYQQAPCDGTPSSSNSKNPHGNTPTPTSSSSSGQKRLSDDGSGYSNPSDNNGDGKRKRPRNVSQALSASTRKWACPYYQRDPHSYCIEGDFGDYRKCSRSPGFSEVHRVKQHLYDCHAAVYCTRCYSQFKMKGDLVAHRRNTVPCGLQDPQPLQGLNEDQRELLKPRDRNKSEKERWETVYKICFPTDQIIPSPYYVHYTWETALLRRQVIQIVEEETMFVDSMIRQRLLRRLQSAFDNNAQTSGPSQSPLWASRVLDLSGNDGMYMSATVLPVNNRPPWSEWETRHANPEDIVQNENLEHHRLVTDDNAQFTGPSLESAFFLPDISSFEFNFGTGDGDDGTGLNDAE